MAAPPELVGSKLIYKFERDTTRLPTQEDVYEKDYRRTTVSIPSASRGIFLEAWLYEPVSQHPKPAAPPVVIMSHGLGLQKDHNLALHAQPFAQAGLAVLVIDFRSFGGSDGEPRHVLSSKRQREDIQSALDYVARSGLGTGRVDASRIALWGYCYSGGHVLSVASKQHNHDKVKAVVSCAPYLTRKRTLGKAVAERGRGTVFRVMSLALYDKARALVGMSPLYMPIYGRRGTLSFAALSPEQVEAWGSVPNANVPKIGGWRPYAGARFLIDDFPYKPLKKGVVHALARSLSVFVRVKALVSRIQCPTLLVAGTNDRSVPLPLMHEAKGLLGDRGHIIEHDAGHMDLFYKLINPKEMAQVVNFLRLHLGLPRLEHGSTYQGDSDTRTESSIPTTPQSL